jgi:hypothetical protein
MASGKSTVTGILAGAAVISSAFLLGAWDNGRTIQRMLDHGYETTAMITGANEQHRAPLTFDDLRPRFLDQTYSLDLTWRGRDGAARERQKVPVTDEYIGSLMVGSKVRLIAVPIKVVDEDGAVPAIVPDAQRRLQRLRGWTTFLGYAALAAWMMLLGNLGWRAWRSRDTAAGAIAAAGHTGQLRIPLGLAIATVFSLAGSAMAGYFSVADAMASREMRDHGVELAARILDIHATPGKDNTVTYAIDLGWRDRSGAERRYGRTHISASYANRIMFNGALATRQTTIRYLEENPSARPIVVADADERAMQDRVGLIMCAVFGFAGLVLGGLTVWRTERGAPEVAGRRAAPARG